MTTLLLFIGLLLAGAVAGVLLTGLLFFGFACCALYFMDLAECGRSQEDAA